MRIVCKNGRQVDREGILLGLFSKGSAPAIIVNAPFTNPEPPIPATALPTINSGDEFDTPQIKDPSSNQSTDIRKINYLGVRAGFVG
jgi:hypothetical protein